MEIQDILPPPKLEDLVTLTLQEKKKNKKKLYKQRVKDRKKDNNLKDIKPPPLPETDKDDIKSKLRNKIHGIRQKRDGTTQRKAEDMKHNLFGNAKNLNISTIMNKLGIKDDKTKKMIEGIVKSGNIHQIEQQILKELEKK